MEGAIFYWVFWLFWVILTFFVSKQNPYRVRLAAMVLIVIICSASKISIGNTDIILSGAIVLLFAYSFLGQEKGRTIGYSLICSLIVSIAYVTFQLFEIFDPIWILFNRDLMMGIVIGYVVLLLQKTLKGRLLIAVCGTMQGEFLYGYIVSNFQFPYQIGGYSYLDVCSLVAVLLAAWSLLEAAGPFLQSHFQFPNRGKQKTS